MSTIRFKRTSWTAWAGLVCVLALLIVSTAQASHICSFQLSTSPGLAGGRVSAAGSVRCLTCLMAQTATPAILFFALSLLVMARQISPGEGQGKAFGAGVELCVRPPASCYLFNVC